MVQIKRGYTGSVRYSGTLAINELRIGFSDCQNIVVNECYAKGSRNIGYIISHVLRSTVIVHLQNVDKGFRKLVRDNEPSAIRAEKQFCGLRIGPSSNP